MRKILMTLALAAFLWPADASAETYVCTCPAGCGNGGVGANAGKVMRGIKRKQLPRLFGLNGPGRSKRTGWTCVVAGGGNPRQAARRPPARGGNAVRLFADGNYRGRSVALGPGNYDIKHLSRTIGNDKLSSLRVPPGWKVVLFQHAGFRGRKYVVNGNVPMLGGGFNDQAASARVMRNNRRPNRPQPVRRPPNRRPRQGVTVYEHGNYKGRSKVLYPGRYDINRMGIPNDSLSSFRVPVGFQITIYQHGRFRGWSKPFNRSVNMLGRKWNDQTSAIVIRSNRR